MAQFFKTLGLGLLYTVALPFALLLLALYGVFGFVVFLIQLVRNIVVFFSGGTVGGDLPEDVEAKKILIEKHRAELNPAPEAPVTTNTNTNSNNTTTNNIFVITDKEGDLSGILPKLNELTTKKEPEALEEGKLEEIELKEEEVKEDE